MYKKKEYNISETNIANLGSEIEKKVRESAASAEPAWFNAGKEVGLQIWRIEKFQVVSWPKELYGSFYNGDSYIVLNTYKKNKSEKLCWDVHFWLGKYTTQDEAGTAAYKTVELDDLLGGEPVQHREVQEHESSLFMSYFANEIKIMEGGIESGFTKVVQEEHKSRLLHLKGKKKIRVTEVPMIRDSLNSGDVFILDTHSVIYQWNGKKSGPGEKTKGAQLCRALADERKGIPKIYVIEEGDHDKEFWSLLGGEGPIKTAEEGGSDLEAENMMFEKRLFQLSDASGEMKFTEIATGKNIKKNLLDSNDVFILDTGSEVIAWIGKGSSIQEKKKAIQYAQDYLVKYNRPLYLPISRILEGGENEMWEQAFN
jgi:gelsolin